jgi:hypothetical protein
LTGDLSAFGLVGVSNVLTCRRVDGSVAGDSVTTPGEDDESDDIEYGSGDDDVGGGTRLREKEMVTNVQQRFASRRDRIKEVSKFWLAKPQICLVAAVTREAIDRYRKKKTNTRYAAQQLRLDTVLSRQTI